MSLAGHPFLVPRGGVHLAMPQYPGHPQDLPPGPYGGALWAEGGLSMVPAWVDPPVAYASLTGVLVSPKGVGSTSPYDGWLPTPWPECQLPMVLGRELFVGLLDESSA